MVVSPIARVVRKKLSEGGGVKNILHTNNLSENNLLVRSICTRLSRPKEVGGYIREGILRAGLAKMTK